MANNGNVQFKYSIGRPTNVVSGAFYWVLENSKNRLYFSPSTDPDGLLRIDNILSGNTTVVNTVIELASVLDVPEDTTSFRTDSDWEGYIKSISDAAKYGSLNNSKPFKQGNIIICGVREFICTESTITYAKKTLMGVDYYKKRDVDEIYKDNDGNGVLYNDIAPDYAEVEEIETKWECFGRNLSEDYINKISQHTSVKLAEGEDIITLTTGTNENGGTEYSIGLNKENLPYQTINGETAITQGEFIDVKVSAVKGTEDNDYTLTTTSKLTTKEVSVATTEDDGIALASDVKSYVGDVAENTLNSAKSYTDGVVETSLNDAKTYADGVAETSLNSAKSYADGVADTTLDSAKDYTDTKLEEKDASINQQVTEAANVAISNKEAEIKGYADTQISSSIDTAKGEMETYADGAATTALEDAKSYSDTQITSSINTAKGEMETYADGVADTKAAAALSDAKAYSDDKLDEREQSIREYVDTKAFQLNWLLDTEE